MSIYLIRHTTTRVEKGICYGQADVDTTETFYNEAHIIKKLLPGDIQKVFSSPLTRCKKLAEFLFPAQQISFEPDLRELHCGEWELRAWDNIPRTELEGWMNDFVNTMIPEGESYLQLYNRVVNCFERITLSEKPLAVVTHAGVIRSILAHITKTPLIESFAVFKLQYGCVVKISPGHGHPAFEILSPISSGAEQLKSD